MLEKVLAGEKTVTRRLHGRNSRVEGKTLPIRATNGSDPDGHIHVTSIESVRLTDLSPDEARLEGFATPDAFREWWLDRYGPDSWHGRVDRIEFRLVRDVTVVCPYCDETTVADEEGVFELGDVFYCSSCDEELSLLDFPTYVKTPA